MPIDRRSSFRSTFADFVDGPAERAREALEAAIERMGVWTRSPGIAATAVQTRIRDALRSTLLEDDAACAAAVAAADDRERLKIAAVAGVVLFLGCAAIFLSYRAFVLRERRLQAENVARRAQSEEHVNGSAGRVS